MSPGQLKKTTLYVGLCVGIIALTSGLTYVASTQNLLDWNFDSRDTKAAPSHLYGLFAGHGVCKEAIYKNAPGDVIVLESDDRAAKFNAYDDSNVLTFEAEVKPTEQRFLSEERSTYTIVYRCHTSSIDNSLLKLSHLVVDETGVK